REYAHKEIRMPMSELSMFKTLMSRGVALMALACLGSVQAQEYPSKPISFVVPTSAGTTTDYLARALGAEMSRRLKTEIVVDNRPGANQVIALERVAKQAPADGYTVGVVGVDAMALLPLVTKNLRF